MHYMYLLILQLIFAVCQDNFFTLEELRQAAIVPQTCRNSQTQSRELCAFFFLQGGVTLKNC